MNHKILEKKMELSEIIDFLDKHPKYRLPRMGEVSTDLMHYVSTSTIIDADFNNIQIGETNAGPINSRFKLSVILVRESGEKASFFKRLRLCMSLMFKYDVYENGINYTVKRKEET